MPFLCVYNKVQPSIGKRLDFFAFFVYNVNGCKDGTKYFGRVLRLYFMIIIARMGIIQLNTVE